LITEPDVIYVGGGSTANLLAMWRLHGVDELLRQAWENGVILCGSSAGAACWFEASITDSFGPTLQALRDGLGFLPGTFCPHYNSEEQRRPTLHLGISEGTPAGYAADDRVALHFIDEKLHEVVTPDLEASAYWVERDPSGAVTDRELTIRRI
jgi:peptidase E